MSTRPDSLRNLVKLTDVLRHPENALLAQLHEQKETVVERQPLLTQAALDRLVAKLTNTPANLQAPLVQLSARHPFDPAASLDMYQPGRWDASTDLVYMDPIVHPNPGNPGEWTGSAGYVAFHPPSAGTFVMILHFFGYQVTMTLNGPSGTTTATSAGNAPSAVAALFSGSSAGFSFACTGIYLGFVQSIQIFQL